MAEYYVEKLSQAGGDHVVHVRDCKLAPAIEDLIYLGDFTARAPAVRRVRKRFPRSSACAECTLDERFCKQALDGLFSFRRKVFIRVFMRRHGLTSNDDTYASMRKAVAKWMRGDDSKCIELLDYVDSLKLWGRQRVFLFEVDEKYLTELSKESSVREIFSDTYERPRYRWELEAPLLVHVRYDGRPGTDRRRLILKLVEMREYDVLENGRMKKRVTRSTNYFVVNLTSGFAELRLEALPTGARRNIKKEYEFNCKELARYLPLGKFQLVAIEPVMVAILKHPFALITAYSFGATKGLIPSQKTTPKPVMNFLSKASIPRSLNTSWICKQNVLHKKRLHFRLNGNSDYVAFDGIAYRRRLGDVLAKIVEISRSVLPPGMGMMAQRYRKAEGQRKKKAAILSTGVVAAAFIWALLQYVAQPLLEGQIERLLFGLPFWVIKAAFVISWTVAYYGWKRMYWSFRDLFRMSPPDRWKELMEARGLKPGFDLLAKTDE